MVRQLGLVALVAEAATASLPPTTAVEVEVEVEVEAEVEEVEVAEVRPLPSEVLPSHTQAPRPRPRQAVLAHLSCLHRLSQPTPGAAAAVAVAVAVAVAAAAAAAVAVAAAVAIESQPLLLHHRWRRLRPWPHLPMLPLLPLSVKILMSQAIVVVAGKRVAASPKASIWRPRCFRRLLSRPMKNRVTDAVGVADAGVVGVGE